MRRFVADDVGDDDALGRLGPLAILADARAEGAGSDEDAGRRGGGGSGLIENVFEHEAKIAAADFIESEGIGVTVDGNPGDGLVVFFVVPGDGFGAKRGAPRAVVAASTLSGLRRHRPKVAGLP